MGYSHTFYAVDLDRLRGLWGSSDDGFAVTLFDAKEEQIEDNDAFFEDAIDGGDCPDTRQAVRDLLSGKVQDQKGGEAMYGYTLGIVCDHMGTLVEAEEVYSVGQHPYTSKLSRSGPPLPIPVDPADFPEIGFVAKEDLPAEIQAIDDAPRRAKKSLMLSLLSALTGGLVGKQMDDDEVAEDMQAYRDALVFCRDRGLSIVSLRH